MNRFQKLVNKLLPSNSFARGVSVLVSGTVVAQALMVLVSPILTRIYTPDDFGLLAVYASVLSLFTVVASLRYQLAIPLPERESEAAHIALLSVLLVVLTSFSSGFLIWLGGDFLAQAINTPSMGDYLWLIPIGVFVIGCYEVFYYWAVRTKSFGTIASTKVSQSLATIIVQLAAFKIGALALIVGQTAGQAMGVWRLAQNGLNNKYFAQWGWEDLKKVAVRYKSFPLFSTWGGFLNAASMQLPPLLFAILFSPGAAGFYALAHRVLAMPMSLVGSAVGNVFLANAADAHREGNLANLFQSVYAKLVAFIMPVMMVLLVDAPHLFTLVFGENWGQAGELARWMAPWLAIVFVASPLSILYEVLEKQKWGMCFQALMLSVRILALGIGYHYDSMMLAVILFSLFSVFCWIGFLVWAAGQTKCNLYQLVKPIFSPLLLSIICITPLLLTSLVNIPKLNWYLGFLFTVLMLAIYYFVVAKKSYIQ